MNDIRNERLRERERELVSHWEMSGRRMLGGLYMGNQCVPRHVTHRKTVEFPLFAEENCRWYLVATEIEQYSGL